MEAFLVDVCIDELHVITERSVHRGMVCVIPSHALNLGPHVGSEETNASYISVHVTNDVFHAEPIVTRFAQMRHES